MRFLNSPTFRHWLQQASSKQLKPLCFILRLLTISPVPSRSSIRYPRTAFHRTQHSCQPSKVFSTPRAPRRSPAFNAPDNTTVPYWLFPRHAPTLQHRASLSPHVTIQSSLATCRRPTRCPSNASNTYTVSQRPFPAHVT